MSDLAGLLKELEQVAKDTNLKEVKNKPLEESVASKDDVSSLFEGLETAYTETKIEEEVANRLSEEDERNLGAFSGFMESVTELTNQPNSQKAIENLFATVAPPQPLIEISDEPVIIEKVVEEPIEVEQADTIIQQIVSSLEDMGEKTEIKEQVDQISKLRNEFNNFRALMQQQVLSHTPGSGEVRLEFLDDVERSTAKVDGKFLKYSSSDGKFIGDDASVTSLAITALDIDGGTDIGAAIADADLFIVDDGAGGTNRKTVASRIKTYIADVTLTTAAQTNITSLGTITGLTIGDASTVFEGATADNHETTLRVDDPTADRKVSIQDKTGTIDLVSGFLLSGTDGSSTNAGDFIVLNTSADDGDRLLYEDGTSDIIAVLASHGITLVGQGWNAFRFDNSI